MKEKLKANWGIMILTAVLFVFGILTSVIGWTAADKLSSIDKTLQKLESWLIDEKAMNSQQNTEIQVLKEKTANNEKDIKEIKRVNSNGQNN